jgi:hypothetical protein
LYEYWKVKKQNKLYYLFQHKWLKNDEIDCLIYWIFTDKARAKRFMFSWTYIFKSDHRSMLNYLILHLMSDKMTLSNFLIMNIYRHRKTRPEIIKWSSTSTYTHPTTGYLDNRSYRELRSYLRHTEWQVGISLTFFFHFIYFSKESTSFYHIHEKYSVSSTFLYNGNSKCYVVRILYAISFQWSTWFGYRGQLIHTMVLDKKLFFNGFHSFENIFLLRTNLNVLKFKGNH